MSEPLKNPGNATEPARAASLNHDSAWRAAIGESVATGIATSAGIRAHWRPAADLPRFDQPTTIVIAFPPTEDGDDTEWYMAGAIYIAHPDGRIASENSDIPILSTDFWWCEESALLAGLPT